MLGIGLTHALKVDKLIPSMRGVSIILNVGLQLVLGEFFYFFFFFAICICNCSGGKLTQGTPMLEVHSGVPTWVTHCGTPLCTSFMGVNAHVTPALCGT